MGSCSVVQCLRHLMGQPLYCLGADAGVWGEKGYGDGSIPYTWLSGIALLPWLPDFLHWHFPLGSPPSHPLNLSLQVDSSACPGIAPHSTNSSSQLLHLPVALIPVQGMYGCSKDCLILFPFRLPQISCFTLSLKCFSSDSDNCPSVGIRPLLQFPHPARAGPVILALLVPSSYFTWFFILFRWSGTPVCSQLVFCMHFMYPWRETYSTSTYSSAILFFPPFF